VIIIIWRTKRKRERRRRKIKGERTRDGRKDIVERRQINAKKIKWEREREEQNEGKRKRRRVREGGDIKSGR
jgi:hypothetical protein